MGPQPAHAGEVVLELCQLDLQLALGGAAWSAKMSRMIAVRSITGTPTLLLEVALLARQQLVVAGDQVRVGCP